MRSLHIRIGIGLLVIALLLPASYWYEGYDRSKGVRSGSIIKVQDKLSGKLVSLMGVDVLHNLAAQQFPGNPGIKGPTLPYAIGASGLSGYKRVELKGLRSGEVFRTDKQNMNAAYVLAFNNRGTVDLIDRNEYDKVMLRDVSEINKVE